MTLLSKAAACRTALVAGALFVGLLAGASRASAAVVVGGGGLLVGGDANELQAWLDNTSLYSGNLQFTNVFTKGQNNSTSADFHAAVDGVGATVTVMSASDGNQTLLIGGFNPVSWNSSDNYTVDATSVGRDAFIFSLSTGDLRPQSLDTVGRYQTYNSISYGPTFGGGHDLYVSNNLSSGYSYTYSYGNSSNNFFGVTTSSDLNITHLETFTISELPSAAPEPETWALMIGGFGLAGAALRRNRSAVAA